MMSMCVRTHVNTDRQEPDESRWLNVLEIMSEQIMILIDQSRVK